MAAFIGLILLCVSAPLLLARYSIWTNGATLASATFFGGEDILSRDFRYSQFVTWLQWPALVTGILEELPASGLVHVIEFAGFVGIYFLIPYMRGAGTRSQ